MRVGKLDPCVSDQGRCSTAFTAPDDCWVVQACYGGGVRLGKAGRWASDGLGAAASVTRIEEQLGEGRGGASSGEGAEWGNASVGVVRGRVSSTRGGAGSSSGAARSSGGVGQCEWRREEGDEARIKK